MEIIRIKKETNLIIYNDDNTVHGSYKNLKRNKFDYIQWRVRILTMGKINQGFTNLIAAR